MQPSGSFYSSGSQRTISGHVSSVYFIKECMRDNKVVWVGRWGRARQRTGPETEGEAERESAGGSINS